MSRARPYFQGCTPLHHPCCTCARQHPTPLPRAAPNLAGAGIALPTPKQLIEEELEQQRAQEVYYAEPTGPALPDRPPYKVYISNIPYQIDEMVVERYFHGLKVR